MLRTPFILTLFFLSACGIFADPGELQLEVNFSGKTWTLAKLHLVTPSKSKVVGQSLEWKLFDESGDQSQLLQTNHTEGEHHNSFLPKEAGTYLLRVYQNDEVLLEEGIEVKSAPNILEKIATTGPAYPDMGYVDWIPKLAEGKKIAFAKKKPLLLAFFTCCVASERPSQVMFKDPSFLERAQNFVVVPIMLGVNESFTEELYQVRSGLSFVTVNADGIQIEYLFRPGLEEINAAMDKALVKNKKLVKAAKKWRKKINKAQNEREEAYYQMELGQFYAEGKAYDQAQICFERGLALLEKSPDPDLKRYITDLLLDLYIRKYDGESVIALLKGKDSLRDYDLMSLGMAYYLKRNTDNAALEKSKAYFETLLTDHPESAYLAFSQQMLGTIAKDLKAK